MLETLVVLFVLSILANWQTVETYHHGDIFSSIRARMEARNDFWSDMTECPFCMSHWTAFFYTTLSLVLACRVHAAPLDWWLIWPAFSLAIARASNLLNDLTYVCCRTPRERNYTFGGLSHDLPGLGDDIP